MYSPTSHTQEMTVPFLVESLLAVLTEESRRLVVECLSFQLDVQESHVMGIVLYKSFSTFNMLPHEHTENVVSN